MIKRLHLIISGKVQTVGYRYQSRKKATLLNLVGYVKNLSDNSVELVAEGKEDNLTKLLEWCRIGPPTALVDKITESWENATNEFTDFKIITT
jgi:acylphosphatase